MTAAIKLKELSRRFGDFRAVDNLSLEIEEGEIFGFLGPNGAGKTTSIKLISGLLKRSGGEARVMGFDPEKQSRQVRRLIGMVPQDTNVYLNLNALDNLRHHAALYCANLDDLDLRIAKLLKLMSLWDRRKDALRTYSGGMKRRLALARSLLHDPRIIFFDEPTLGVDVQGRHVLWDHIRQQKEQGKTFVVSTNDMAEAEALCDRLLIIDHGKLVALGKPDRLKSALGRDIVQIRTSPAVAHPDTLLRGLDAQQISRPEPKVLRFELANGESKVAELVSRITREHTLESIRVARPSLADVFLAHTGRALRE